jgi:hypothetical protein
MSKWLLRKTSGSRSKYKTKGDFSNRRNGKSSSFEDLPQRESMQGKNDKKTFLDTTLVNRWLQSKVNQNFDDVYAEFLTRIQPKYLDEYRNCIYEYLEPSRTVVFEGEVVFGTLHDASVKLPNGKKKLYVDPVSNLIKKAV